MHNDTIYPHQKDGYHRQLMDETKHDEPMHAGICFCGMAPTRKSLQELTDEIVRARIKFPKSRYMFTAIAEEFGELAQAILQRHPIDAIRREALQVACTAMRLYEEGDPVYDNMTDDEAKP